MNKKNKPTSPHLQIYKWSIASTTSIMHRLTGVVIYFLLIAACFAIIYFGNYHPKIVADTNETCHCIMMEIKKYIINLAYFGFVFALFYHFINGIRHLCWDFLHIGFDKNIAKRNGILVIALAAVSSLILFYFFNFI